MRANNVLGIIYSNAYDNALSEITHLRAMGSVPFCSRYRLIDFPLSNFVNCGITKVGIITKSNYQSLMDHLGTGKAWDLSRKREGMFILPPFHERNSGVIRHRIDALNGVQSFLEYSKEEFVLFSDCNVVCNYDLRKLIDFHTEKNADISIVYKNGAIPKLDNMMVFDIDSQGKIKNISLAEQNSQEGNYSTNIIMMRKSLLERLLSQANSLNQKSFEKDILMKNVDKLNMYALEGEGYFETIDSLQGYFDISMKLLNGDNMKMLFDKNNPIYTKSRDKMPAIYGLGSDVKNSLIADGCIIDGTVENSVIFSGTRIAKGAHVKNCVIMQDCFISENANLECIIADKNVVIKPNKSLSSVPTYPVYIGKSITI